MIKKMCPKEYAWFVADCDFGQDCENCELPLAPIAEGDIPNKAKDALHELIKIYQDSEFKEKADKYQSVEKKAI